MRARKIKDDLYGVEILFLAECTFDEMAEYLEKRYEHEIECDFLSGNKVYGYAVTVARPQDADLYCLWVEKRDDCFTLAHEAVHIASYVFKLKCIEYDHENHEHWAYYIEWLMRRFMDCTKPKVQKKTVIAPIDETSQ